MQAYSIEVTFSPKGSKGLAGLDDTSRSKGEISLAISPGVTGYWKYMLSLGCSSQCSTSPVCPCVPLPLTRIADRISRLILAQRIRARGSAVDHDPLVDLKQHQNLYLAAQLYNASRPMTYKSSSR